MAGQPIVFLLLLSIFFSPGTSLFSALESPASAPHLPMSPSPSPVAPPSRTIRAAYWPSWRSSSFPASAIDTSYFTHIYFAFVLPDPNTFQITVDQSSGQLLSNFTAVLRGKVKTLLSIGGGGSNSTTFARMASTPANLKAFIDSTIAVARNYSFDGLDLDWEFPQTQQEMDDLGTLFAKWQAALRLEAEVTGRPQLLLTAAVYFAARFILADNRAYPAHSISENLDWVNAMCFDYRGSWDTSATGAHAALYDPKSNVSTSFGLHSWVNAGVPRGKVVMGLPVYGRTWQLKDPQITGVGAPAVGVGPDNGVMLFKDVMDYNVKYNATVVFDGPTVSTYSYAGTAWIGYDDDTSVKLKIYYAKGLDLGGYFFWALGYDNDWTISRQAWTAWS